MSSGRSSATPTIRAVGPAGLCANPIRLRGWQQQISAESGEVLAQLASPAAPDGMLLVSCKDRRAVRCPSCSALYQRDAYHVVAAGLRGGKSVPASVATHPALMLTLTAPSFGAVHSIPESGRPCGCGSRHAPDDQCLGTALDRSSYRYAEQASWNHLAPQLWKRTVQAIRRNLARELGLPRSHLGRHARVRFAKVAEFQRRGVVHYHAVIRIDGPNGTESTPPLACNTTLLQKVVCSSVREATVPVGRAAEEPGGHLRPRRRRATAKAVVRWGRQIEIAALDQTSCTRAAGYIAKYATKATEDISGGTLVPPVHSPEEIAALDLPEHARALVAAAWKTGAIVGLEGARRWAHQFGYGGHTLTKSRDYSVTFRALRQARSTWRSTDGSGGRASTMTRGKLVYVGRGYKGIRREGPQGGEGQ